jgi:hypothetical protein
MDTGTSWQYLSTNLPMVSVYDMKIHDTAYYLALGTHARSMYKLDLNLLTDLDKGSNASPLAGFQLNQNYPNPFNPSTTISFRVPEERNVTLTIYNSLGQEVATLLSGSLLSGSHRVVWNGRDKNGRPVASGTYIYRLQAGDFNQSRQMVLLK